MCMGDIKLNLVYFIKNKLCLTGQGYGMGKPTKVTIWHLYVVGLLCDNDCNCILK